jgi:hypothetical protein
MDVDHDNGNVTLSSANETTDTIKLLDIISARWLGEVTGFRFALGCEYCVTMQDGSATTGVCTSANALTVTIAETRAFVIFICVANSCVCRALSSSDR